MPSLYLHIPFCKQACHYCDFHFSTNTSGKAALVEAMIREIEIQQGFFQGEEIETLYFGGGTPSLLSEAELGSLMEALHKHFKIKPGAETTLEANPDDLSPAKVKALRAAGINRLSIGIQSFYEPHLRFMNRAHNAQEAENCVKTAQDAGISNITVDLIYGVPADTQEVWENDIRKALGLGVQHLSAYSLTIEPKTVFGKRVAGGKMTEPGDDLSAGHFETLMRRAEEAGFEHYEISNFALPGFYSQHNSNYWKKGAYLGIGPSAHSYDGERRFFNVYHNLKYVQAIGEERLPQTVEELSRLDHINEYLMTGLRTQWGCDAAFLQTRYAFDIFEVCAKEIAAFVESGLLLPDGRYLRLTRKGKLLADSVAEGLFQV